EPVAEPVAGEPERIEAVRRRVIGVDHDFSSRPAHSRDLPGPKTGDHGDVRDAAVPQRSQLPLEQRAVADACEAFGPIGDNAAQAVAASRSKYHRSHTPSESGRRRHAINSAVFAM